MGARAGFMAASPYRVSIRTEDSQRRALSQRWVRDVIRHALTVERAPEGSRVEVLIASDETVAGLNAEFMNEDGPTDVISFPSGLLDETDDSDNDDEWPDVDEISDGELGQIVVCAPQVARQAETAGMTLRDEAAHVLVHATLHLLGHDHELHDDEEAMRAREDAILMDLIGRPVHGTEPMALAHAPGDSASMRSEREFAESVSGRAR